MSRNTSAKVPDGRRLRSERSRQAIIDAAISLMDEGMLVATAQQVADRADVGIRSLFRHFSDMESLYQAVDDQIRGDYEALFLGGDRDGTVDERIQRMAERRAAAYEAVKTVVLATKAQLWRYDVLRKNYARNQRGLRKDLENWLPELLTDEPETRAAADAVASFEMWHRLRENQGLSRKRSIAVIVHMLTALIGES
jgi:AcrR family transcriptional regulator